MNKATRSGKWCLSIHDTPLYKFIEVICDNNPQALVLEGSPHIEDLIKAWETIITEYTEALGSAEHKYYLQLLRDVARTQITLTQIEKLVEILRRTYAKQFADLLNKLLNQKLTFNPDNAEEYDKNLERCLKRSKGYFIDLQLKQGQLQRLEEKLKTKGDSKVDRLYFESALITLSDHAGFHLTDRIMTSEFCMRMNRYTKFIESQNSK